MDVVPLLPANLIFSRKTLMAEIDAFNKRSESVLIFAGIELIFFLVTPIFKNKYCKSQLI